jgi:hypothetical protein
VSKIAISGKLSPLKYLIAISYQVFRSFRTPFAIEKPGHREDRWTKYLVCMRWPSEILALLGIGTRLSSPYCVILPTEPIPALILIQSYIT